MIEYEKRAMIEAEDKYTFRQSTQISMQTGLIGHLRADMDTDGNGFFSSWFDFREELKTDEFKAELDEVINSLREEGDILHNRKALAKYCYSTPQSKMQEEPGYYGVRVDTEKYAYLLRLNPDRGEYNLYCYCYRRDWLDQHLKDAEKGIRFIDSHYKELFRIPDGGKILTSKLRTSRSSRSPKKTAVVPTATLRCCMQSIKSKAQICSLLSALQTAKTAMKTQMHLMQTTGITSPTYLVQHLKLLLKPIPRLLRIRSKPT